MLTTSHVTGPSIAEYVFRAVLDWFQRADEWRAAAHEREWRKHEFREVLGTVWLVIGLGTIGSEVAARAARVRRTRDRHPPHASRRRARR